MSIRRCLNCTAIHDARVLVKGRCPTCAQQHRPDDYTQAAAAHVRAHPHCVHCGTTNDVTAGHVDPGHAAAGFQTECRSCGAQARHHPPRHSP